MSQAKIIETLHNCYSPSVNHLVIRTPALKQTPKASLSNTSAQSPTKNSQISNT